jgi:hypothetical protein
MKIRLKRIVISPEALIHIMSNDTAWRVFKGIPKGSKLRTFTIDPHSGALYLFVEHESFELIDPYQVAPFLETEFARIP